MRKLISLTFTATPRIPGLRAGDFVTIECDNPATSLRDWRAVVRPGLVFLISPPGWAPNNASEPRRRDPKGPRAVVQLAAGDVTLMWQAEDADLEDTYKCGKYESQPFGWKPAPTIVEEPAIIPVNEIGDA